MKYCVVSATCRLVKLVKMFVKKLVKEKLLVCTGLNGSHFQLTIPISKWSDQKQLLNFADSSDCVLHSWQL